MRERADGGLMVMATPRQTNNHPLVRPNEFELVRLTPQGRVVGWDTYCSQTCAQVTPAAWQYLPADSSVIVSGWGQLRDASGRVLAQPAWLARLAQPCRRYLAPAVVTAVATPEATGGLQLYPQPAHAGQTVQVVGTAPRVGPWQLPLTDALGRETARLTAWPDASGAATFRLPSALQPGLYVLHLPAANGALVARKLLVLAAEQ